jgi:hypothetical protein
LADFFVCGVGDALEDVGEVGVRVDAASAAAFDDAVNDGAAVADVGSSDEEPVLLADGRGAVSVFGEVVVDLDLAFCEVDFEALPLP